MCIIGGVTDKDLEVMLSVIHSKVEAIMRQLAALDGSSRGRPASEARTASKLLQQLAWELQGMAWHYGYPDAVSLLGEVKQMEVMRAMRSSFLQMQFGHSYRFVPCWHPPFYGLN